MQLSELFVSHKQVDPVIFDREEPSLPSPIYLNLDRAKKVTAPETDKPDFTTQTDTLIEQPLNWRVANYDSVKNTQELTQSNTPTQNSPISTPTTTTPKSWVNPYKGKRSKWMTDMTNAYKRAGLSDNAIKNLLTKNALESGYGTYAQGDFNFGNITAGKSWKGRIVNGRDSNKNGQAIKQQFRAYDSLDDYVKDEIQFLTSLYDFNPNDDFTTFSNKLQGANKDRRRYAEASSYVETLQNVYNSIYGKGHS